MAFAGRTVLAVVPARGGSKGVPLKNIHPLLGRPLIAYTADVARGLACCDRAVVSTDHPDIARAASEAGLEVPFLRPPELSGDRIGDREVLAHALTAVEALGGARYDLVVMLQPTAPLRRSSDVEETIRVLVEGDWDAVWTVSPTDLKFHPLKQLRVGDGGALSYYDQAGGRVIARQQLEPLYHRNGIAYAFTRDCLLNQQTIMGPRSAAVVVAEPGVNIDTLEDFARAEEILRSRRKAQE
jgi:CMP-N,N'-diacetyllegionaminic acid synthase